MNTEWNVQRMAVKKRRFPRFEIELHLEKEYVLAIFEEMRQSRFTVYLFQYSEGQHRSHEWVCDQQPKVKSLLNTGLYILNRFPGLTFAQRPNMRRHTGTHRNFSDQPGRVPSSRTTTGSPYTTASSSWSISRFQPSFNTPFFLSEHCL
jgi:hypothetical protein